MLNEHYYDSFWIQDTGAILQILMTKWNGDAVVCLFLTYIYAVQHETNVFPQTGVGAEFNGTLRTAVELLFCQIGAGLQSVEFVL